MKMNYLNIIKNYINTKDKQRIVDSERLFNIKLKRLLNIF